jgi:hypothetical protein
MVISLANIETIQTMVHPGNYKSPNGFYSAVCKNCSNELSDSGAADDKRVNTCYDCIKVKGMNGVIGLERLYDNRQPVFVTSDPSRGIRNIVTPV